MKQQLERLLLGTKPKPARIPFGPLRGRRIVVDRAAETTHWLGIFDRELQRALLDNAKPGTVAFDIGSFRGFFALLLAQATGRAVAVEPDPRNRELVERTIALNTLQVTVVPAAVGAEPGHAKFLLADVPSCSRMEASPYRANVVSESIDTEVTTLDALAEIYGCPSIIKIDVEGAEDAVLAGGSGVLKRRPVIVCELHGDVAAPETLRELGYRVTHLDENKILGTPA